MIASLVTCIFSGCITMKTHPYAELDENSAKESIMRLKLDTLVVVMPTYSNKEAILKSALAKNLELLRLKRNWQNVHYTSLI